MQVQVNTDRNIDGHEKLGEWVSDTVNDALDRFDDHITRVEVHLSDENGSKNNGDDKRCVMEARIKGRQPTAVTHEAGSVDQAVSGAADKLVRALESTLGRLNERPRGRKPVPDDALGGIPEV